MANRVLSVGSLGRAQLLARVLDEGSLEMYESSRGFAIFTGLMNGVAVSIIATGMVRACCSAAGLLTDGLDSIHAMRAGHSQHGLRGA